MKLKKPLQVFHAAVFLIDLIHQGCLAKTIIRCIKLCAS